MSVFKMAAYDTCFHVWIDADLHVSVSPDEDKYDSGHDTVSKMCLTKI